MKKQKESTWLMIARLLLAGVFIFSGLSKMIDPVASGIQMDDYFISFGMGFLHPFSLTLGILMNIAEFTLGFMLLFRIRVSLTALGFLFFMVFFFFLTAWLAVAEHLEVNYGYNLNVVKDCGCFGKAIAMSNLGTFLKNVALLMITLIVFGKRKSIPDIRLTLLGQWLFACVGSGIALFIQIYCLRNLPIIDLTEWKKGKDMVELLVEKPAKIEMLFLYKNEKGIEKLLSMEEMETITESIPKFYEEYYFIDRIDSIITEAVKPKITGFSMLDNQGRDFTSIYLDNNKETVYLLFMHDLDEVSKEALQSENLSQLVVYCTNNEINFVGITNSPPEDIKDFIEKNEINFPIYYNPIDPVKGPFVVRDAVSSNPGLIILKNGVVAEKRAWRNF
ncbi:MAG: DoxX family protein [Bacteroidales bacterium]|jgi:uncharacterized membrane protein YphA (DoxX/SURF4 family)/ribosome biogenesis protein Nip4|nr:DoxX family protein [Bacteroidales bacterium]